MAKAFLFSSALFIVELAEGTMLSYALLVFCYFMISVLAFNLAGGFSRPSGGYIFFYSTLVAGVGTVYKALLGQAANTHLYDPVLTMGVYTATTGALLIAAYITRLLVNTRDGIAGVIKVPEINFGISALGCVIVVFLINNSFYLFSGGSGSILHAISMVNYFLPLGILFGTIAAVKNSGGRRTTSALTLIVIVYSTYNGLLTFSKQAMFTPFVCWVLGLAWSRAQLRPRHLVTLIAFSVIAQGFMVPLANVGRTESGTSSEDVRAATVQKYIEHPFLLRERNRERVAAYAETGLWYYGTSQGIFDRFTMLPPDSELIAYTAQGHYFGYLPIVAYIENWIPHALNPHKLEGVVVGGNRYAHELGELADEDTTTGISFSPSGEAFHIDGWTCVVLVQPLIFALLFVVTDFVCGDLRAQPWGLLPMLLFSHIAPEQLLGGTINYVWLGNVGTIFAIFVCGYVTPVFGKLLKGRESEPLWRSGLPQMVAAEAS